MKIEVAASHGVVRVHPIERLRSEQRHWGRRGSGYPGKDTGLDSSLPPSRQREQLKQRGTQYVLGKAVGPVWLDGRNGGTE